MTEPTACAEQALPLNPRDQAAADARLRAMVHGHCDFIWLTLRRLGVRDADVEDAAQQVFIVAARKLASIELGRERAFLFASALREASHVRRTYGRRRETDAPPSEERVDTGPNPEEIADLHRARVLVDEVLDGMDLDLRAVLVLYEVEEMSTPQIAELLEIPKGTVASRLRRAREEFQAQVNRMNLVASRRGIER